MAKSRKRVFPKPVPRLTEKSAKLLGKNSNKGGYEASVNAIYKSNPKIVDSLTPEQRKMLVNLRRNLSSTYQKDS